MMTYRFVQMMVCLVLVALWSGCAGSMRPSEIAGPPIDLTNALDQDELRQIVSSSNLQLSTFNEEYYLGPGDVINVQLVGRNDLLSAKSETPGLDITLTNNPNITLPEIGSIRAHGKTTEQLQEDLRQAFSLRIVNPQPVVLVKVFNRNQIAVLGSVSKPGKYPFDFGDTALDGVFKAGGLSTGGRGGGTAPGRFMKIYREKIPLEDRFRLNLDELVQRIMSGDKVVPREEITIPISDFVFNGVLEYNIPLKQNDIVYVPPAGTVHVQGRVDSPGIVFLGPSIQTVSQAVVERGGLRFSADDRVEIIRRLPDGQTASYYVSIRQIMTRRSPDFVIKDGDEIFVFPNTWRAIGEAIGTIFSGGIRAGANATYNPIG